MIDISELESRHKKAQIRAERAKIAYENSKSELDRLETALSVVRELSGAKAPPVNSEGSLTTRQEFVFKALKIGKNNAMSPVEVFQVASNDDGFDGDVNYVRTTLWRMAGKGQIEGAGGTYWRFGKAEELDIDAMLGSTQPNTPWDDDLDSEIPF